MFQIEHISKAYGKKQILNDVSIRVDSGEAVGILGTNGSGKSTLLSTIAKKHSGELRLGYVPQENPLFDELKPVDNIKLWVKLTKEEIIDALSKPPLVSLGIINFLDTPVKKMSGGMKKRLSLATVLINKPDILLMDEPLAALDMPAKQDILDFLREYLQQGGSVLVASHDENIFNFCTHVYLLQNGTLTDIDELKAKGISYIDMLRS
jgi:ABC-2 type transport system ATP-binding protein